MTNLILALLQACAALLDIISWRRRAKGRVRSPFQAVPRAELLDSLSSPLRVTPPRVRPILWPGTAPGIHIFTGPSGVGKTREAADFAEALARTMGAECVYVARGYVPPLASLGAKAHVRRVVVLVDDYDYGFVPAAARSFVERQSDYTEALRNLSRLHANLASRVELLALVVTVNRHRLPLLMDEMARILPQTRILDVPPVTPEEHRRFVVAVAESLGLKFTKDALGVLQDACDGRFSSPAIFLSRFPAGSTVELGEAKEYSSFLQAGWAVFSESLSDEQRHVYEHARALWSFALPPRLEYLTDLLQTGGCLMTSESVTQLVTSMWRVKDSVALIYDGQMGPRSVGAEEAPMVAEAIARVGATRRHQDRYAFQSEIKYFAWLLLRLPYDHSYVALLRKLARWYRYDRFFACLLAELYVSRRRFFRAMWVLYRVLRRRDARGIFSGKWIEMQVHLLLARVYILLNIHRRPDWFAHRAVEREFEQAVLLADFGRPDCGAEGYAVVATADSEANALRGMELGLKELGYEKPPGLDLDVVRLRALVHYQYSSYLLDQMHREHDALRHAEVAHDLVPEFGEALLNCARACLQIGDGRRALGFLDKAATAPGVLGDPAQFEYRLSYASWRAHEDTGSIGEARGWFWRCIELANASPLCANAQLIENLRQTASDPAYWDRAERIARMRTKTFSDTLVYHVNPLGLQVTLPADWKVAQEGSSGSTDMGSLLAVFSSPLTWNDARRCPEDCSVDFYYSNTPEDMSLDAKSFGLRRLEELGKAHPKAASWVLRHEPAALGQATVCRWDIKLRHRWPKTGMQLAFALPQARVHLRLMCETCAVTVLWPALEAIAETFREQGPFRQELRPSV